MRFALYIHNHQPAGNFDEVYEYAYTHSYLPLLATLLKHKRVKFGIHNSGTLLEWISRHHPEFFDMVKEAVVTGQAEILTSAYAEPLLTFIPKKDMVEQIKYFNDYLVKHFDYCPKGLWLTERVWEPGLIAPLTDAGIEYILLDDTHFLYAGLEDDELHSYYITEDEGKLLKVFPISMKLRYLIPFHPIDETIAFLREEAAKYPNPLKTLGDDGEKFGVWPGTYDWVHTKGWLDTFLTRLEGEPWIETVFLRTIAQEPPAGRIYFPTSSYEEMGEWVLPPERGREYDELKKTIDKKYYYLIHGGYFRNFLRKYPEANLMHKRMLYVSKNIANDPRAKLSLWKGQCSCAYWHGIFGGLYLPHLREAVYKNLIEAENIPMKNDFRVVDFDVDGAQELCFTNDQFFLVLKPATASFIEIDDRERKQNILNYLSRRKEKYHQRLSEKSSSEGVKSIHEVFQSKEQHLQDYLVYDTYTRGFGIDRMLDAVPTSEDFYRGQNLGTIITYTNYTVVDKDRFIVTFLGPAQKTIQIAGDKHRTIQLSYRGDTRLLGVEFSLGIFRSNLRLKTGEKLTEIQAFDNLRHFTIEADNYAPITYEASEPFSLLTYPITTISSSEAGFEKIFQGFSMLLVFTRLPIISIQL